MMIIDTWKSSDYCWKWVLVVRWRWLLQLCWNMMETLRCWRRWTYCQSSFPGNIFQRTPWTTLACCWVFMSAKADNFIGKGSGPLRSFINWCLILIMIDILSHLPNLQDVILRHTCNQEVFWLVPRKVRDFACVTSMYKKQLWWPILCIFRGLLLSNSVNPMIQTQILNMEEDLKHQTLAHVQWLTL